MLNRTDNSTIEGKTPFELWFDKKPVIDNLKVFGTEVYIHIPNKNDVSGLKNQRKVFWLVFVKIQIVYILKAKIK